MSFETIKSTNAALELMKERLSRIQTEECILKAKGFKPRPSDVFVVTPGKCGTTWMQQIVHQLRTGGDMEFSEITEVVPWLELAYDMHLDLEDEQKQAPRCYKTHHNYDQCPKGGKYIVIYREPCAAFYSMFNFFQGSYFHPGEISLDEFMNEFVLRRGKPKTELGKLNLYDHLLGWWKHRHDPNVLMLFFEEMKQDLESVVKVVASFMGISEEENIRKAVQMSTFKFMKANGGKFDDNLLLLHRGKAIGLPEGISLAKVVTGSATKALDILPDNLKKDLQKKWCEKVTPAIGFQTYDELKIAFRKEKPLLI